MIDHIDNKVNMGDRLFLNKISTPLEVEGGKVFVNRLVHLFNFRSKVELSEFIGVSTGSVATWQTRGVLPYELVVRIHLATGISIEYLLFEELIGDLNVMQYLPDPTIQPNYANIKINISKFRYSLTQPANYDGGAVIIERLVSLFRLESKKELGELLDVSVGTLSTWHTRKITPHELLCRIHLATGVSMHYLCFGKEWEDVSSTRSKAKRLSNAKVIQQSGDSYCEIPEMLLKIDSDSNESEMIDFPEFIDIPPSVVADNPKQYSVPPVSILKSPLYCIDDGSMTQNGNYRSSELLWQHAGVNPINGIVIRHNQATYFINPEIKTVTKGQYLFSINNVHQIGELKQLPDGKIYFIDGDDKYEITEDTTKVIGKVISVLQMLN